MTAAPKFCPLTGVAFRGGSACQARQGGCKADALREETGKSTEGTLRGRGPGECERIAEIKSGRSVSQQRLAATCKDLSYKENEIDGRDSDWRMSPDEL
jgi:hypothetical protein